MTRLIHAPFRGYVGPPKAEGAEGPGPHINSTMANHRSGIRKETVDCRSLEIMLTGNGRCGRVGHAIGP